MKPPYRNERPRRRKRESNGKTAIFGLEGANRFENPCDGQGNILGMEKELNERREIWPANRFSNLPAVPCGPDELFSLI
jgi:hypothetical protein